MNENFGMDYYLIKKIDETSYEQQVCCYCGNHLVYKGYVLIKNTKKRHSWMCEQCGRTEHSEDEPIPTIKLAEHLEAIEGDTDHDVANCNICNPTFKVNLDENELELVRAFCLKEGWGHKVENPLEIDSLDYETLINDDVIKPIGEIEEWKASFVNAVYA